jgi:hypothetical protein
VHKATIRSGLWKCMHQDTKLREPSISFVTYFADCNSFEKLYRVRLDFHTWQSEHWVGSQIHDVRAVNRDYLPLLIQISELCHIFKTWKWYNEELYNLYSSPNIIWMIKSGRMRWARNVACMEKMCIEGFGRKTWSKNTTRKIKT